MDLPDDLRSLPRGGCHQCKRRSDFNNPFDFEILVSFLHQLGCLNFGEVLLKMVEVKGAIEVKAITHRYEAYVRVFQKT
jgi:hypothetical protein